MGKIKIVVADDHQLFRQGLAYIIMNSQDMTLLYEVSNGKELINKLESSADDQLPDVILMDLKMPEMDGVEATEQVKLMHPEIKVLVLTMIDDEDYILHLLDIGVNGYLLKESSAGELTEAIREVVRKDFYFNDYVSRIMLGGIRRKVGSAKEKNTGAEIMLTAREQEVLDLIVQEHTTEEIADKLFVSKRTVETHRKNLIDKFGARNTAGLIVRAIKNNALEI